MWLKGDTGRTGLGEFCTDENGTLTEQIRVPDLPPGQYALVVKTRSDVGKDTIVRKVQILRPYRLHLTTDRPAYQPGQTLHMRVILLNRSTLRPFADQEVSFEVEDANGNRMWRQRRRTSHYGTASTDFELADRINLGRYLVRVKAGDVESEKTVFVERYVPPKFRVEVITDKPYCLPAGTLAGRIRAAYFFGKPVADAQVEIVARNSVASPTPVGTFAGRTDAAGNMAFEIPLRLHFAGMPLSAGAATLDVEARVVDAAGHEERGAAHCVVVAEPIKIHVLPESGDLVPGVVNLVYVLATYPGGRPARCRLQVNEDTLSTDSLGVAVVRVLPGEPRFGRRLLRIRARDGAGRAGTWEGEMVPGRGTPSILLRTDKAVYAAGETVNVAVVPTARRDACFLDVIKDGQTVLTRTLALEEARWKLALALPPSLSGTLKLTAYATTPYGAGIADSRVIHVVQARGLSILTLPDRDSYKPGETARIRLTVTDYLGNPVRAALGISAVDEAVFDVRENRPGSVARFFAADEEVLRPAYQMGFAVSPEMLLAPDDAGQKLALALFSKAGGAPETPPSLDAAVAAGYIEPETAAHLRERLGLGLYAYYQDDPDYRELVEAIRPRGDHTLRAATYPVKQARAERTREWLKAGVVMVLLILIGLLPAVSLACAQLRLARATRTHAVDPTRAAVQRVVNGITHSLWLVFLFPLVTYGGGVIVRAVFGGLVGSSLGGGTLMWGLLGANVTTALTVIAYQVGLCRELMRSAPTRWLGVRLIWVPLTFGLQYAITRGVIVAAALGHIGLGYGLLAGFVSFLLCLSIMATAFEFAGLEGAAYGVVLPPRPRLVDVIAVLLIVGILGAMLTPALARVREEAHRPGPAPELHTLRLALSMYEEGPTTPESQRASAPAPRLR
jgi:hypothetical protein